MERVWVRLKSGETKTYGPEAGVDFDVDADMFGIVSVKSAAQDDVRVLEQFDGDKVDEYGAG